MTASEAKVLEVPAAVSLKRILIATDFSPASERALWYGLAIARRFGASVDIVHIVDSLGFRMTGADVVAQAVELAQRDLKKLETGLVRSGPLDGIPHRMLVQEESREVWEALYRLIRENGINLVVLGTHGRTGLKKLILGSVAEEVFRHSPCPVLTVGPCVAPDLIVTNPPHNILFPTDLSPESLQALPFAIEAARKCGAELTLIHVLPAISGQARGNRERFFEDIRGRLESLVPDNPGLVRNSMCVVEEGYFPAIIVNFVNAHQIDLIVLGLRSPEPYVNRLVWQHAYDIVCQARCPVLTLRSARL
jgi:nucleotide-binding universal stress UspA family protein